MCSRILPLPDSEVLALALTFKGLMTDETHVDAWPRCASLEALRSLVPSREDSVNLARLLSLSYEMGVRVHNSQPQHINIVMKYRAVHFSN